MPDAACWLRRLVDGFIPYHLTQRRKAIEISAPPLERAENGTPSLSQGASTRTMSREPSLRTSLIFDSGLVRSITTWSSLPRDFL